MSAAASQGLQSAKQPLIYILCAVFYVPTVFLKIPRFLSWVSDTMGFKFPKPTETVKQKVNELPCISVFRGQRKFRGHSGAPHIIGLDPLCTSFLPRGRTSFLDRAPAGLSLPASGTQPGVVSGFPYTQGPTTNSGENHVHFSWLL